MQSLQRIDDWEVPHAAVAVVRPGGVVATRGDTTRPYRLASIAKLLTAHAVMVAVEEGTVALDQPAGPPGATLEHLLAHASGYGFESDARAIARPAARRIYSNRGIEEAAALVASASGIAFGAYLHEGVLAPLGMTATELRSSPAYGIWSTVDDVARYVGELFVPRVLAPETVASMRAVHFPGLTGVLPGVGRYEALDFGLGLERNFAKPRHWAGTRLSSETYGHFGGAGTFVWLDPIAQLACVCLTDREFDAWALDAWPRFCDALVEEAARS